MKKTQKILFISTVMFLFLSNNLLAVNLREFRDSPLSAMNKEDLDIMSASIDNALEKTPDSETSYWKNPNTGAKGALTPLETLPNNCRRLEIKNQAGGHKGISVFTFCKQADGEWKIAK